MKNLVLFLFLASILTACTNTEDNSPAFQANKEGAFYNALDTRAFLDSEGKFVIEGIDQKERLSLLISGTSEGTYNINGDTINIARYVDESGNIYSSEFGGRGTVVISNYDIVNNSVSGTFNVEMILRDLDSLTFNRGIFFEVPIITLKNEEPPMGNSSTFAAKINDRIFTQPTLTSTNQNNLITVTATRNTQTIKIIFKDDLAPGMYSIDNNDFQAFYIKDNITESATLGNLSIIANNIISKTVKANFSFITESATISSGQFTVTYN